MRFFELIGLFASYRCTSFYLSNLDEQQNDLNWKFSGTIMSLTGSHIRIWLIRDMLLFFFGVSVMQNETIEVPSKATGYPVN